MKNFNEPRPHYEEWKAELDKNIAWADVQIAECQKQLDVMRLLRNGLACSTYPHGVKARYWVLGEPAGSDTREIRNDGAITGTHGAGTISKNWGAGIEDCGK